MAIDAKRVSTIFKALCDCNRVLILESLRDGEKCACVLLENLRVSQPTLSHHMKVLCDSGLVEGRKEGKWMYYKISRDGAERAANVLRDLTAP